MQTIEDSKDLRTGYALLSRAVEYACDKHRTQVRKGTAIPYISHLLAVAELVLEYGGTMTQAAAGVLHDVVEDTDTTIEDVASLFGAEIADVVKACTDTFAYVAPETDLGRWIAADPDGTAASKAPWRERKERHLAKLAEVSRDAAVVVACDKLHNLRCSIADLKSTGRTVEFNAPLADRMWMHVETLRALRDRLPPRLATDLEHATAEWCMLTAQTGEPSAPAFTFDVPTRVAADAWGSVPVGGLVRNDGGYWMLRMREGFDIVRGSSSDDLPLTRGWADAGLDEDDEGEPCFESVGANGEGMLVAVLPREQWTAKDFARVVMEWKASS